MPSHIQIFVRTTDPIRLSDATMARDLIDEAREGPDDPSPAGQLHYDRERARAHARLIAAAPDLLEAVSDLMEDAEDFQIEGSVPRPTWEKLVAAIRKAKEG